MDRRAIADNVTLFARARSKTWQRVLMALVAVPALLIGLLAMHVMAASGDPSGQHSMMATTNAMAPPALSATSIISAEACAQICVPVHDMGPAHETE
jgi:ABC-type tungstate transport system substrate-binding protein